MMTTDSLGTFLGDVSIRARHCWRAMPCLRLPGFMIANVSIRARHCWRAMRRGHQIMGHPAIHPPLLAGDQSAPRHCWRARFQSAPAIAGGINPAGGHTVSEGFNRARHCWRARFAECFNPGPPGGRYVSIRARHCWRAMLAMSQPVPGRGFNPRPPLLAGDAKMCRAAPRSTFQSAPAIAGGRCNSVAWMPLLLVVSIRAPLLAGDACTQRCRRSSAFNPRRPVSIPRPPLPGAQFQSARHLLAAMLAAAPEIGFNPRPPFAGGRCRNDSRRQGGGNAVSIRARHCWRAMQ